MSTVPSKYLDRFTWRHDSILNFIAKSLQPVINVHSSLYADVYDFLNPSIITGENYRPDLLFLIQSKCLYVLELVGFESNLNNNAVRKKEKYPNSINEMSRHYRCVRFVNLSMSSLGVFSVECSTFLDMMNDIGIDKKQQRYKIKKMIIIAIITRYYIFCCRNRNWDSPDLNAILSFFGGGFCLACENIRFSSLFAARDVSRGGTCATQRQKFHADDVKSVRNPVRSADWSTE